MIDTVALKQKIIDMATSGVLSSYDENDESIEVLLSRLPEPSNKRKRLLTQEFDYDDLFEIPDHWKWINLGLISSYGDTPTKVMPNESNADTWILELEDIESGGRLIEKKRVADKEAIGEKTAFKRNQVLYSKLRPYLKKVLVADEDGISTPELISSEIFGGIIPQYIVLCLTNSYVDKVINKRSYGVKMPRVDAGFMVNLPIPIPPVQEQQRIVDLVHSAFEQILTISKLQSAYSLDLEVLKSKIIDAGIQGKLTEQLPDDGNAEDLYVAMREEKARQIKEKQIKKTKGFPELEKGKTTYDLPKSWKVCYLDDIAFVTKLAGFEYTKYIADSISTEGIPLIKGKNVQKGELILEFESFIPKSVSDELLRSKLKKKCLLTPYVGTIGNIALFDGSFEAHLGSNVGKIEIFNTDSTYLMEEYLLLYLRSSYGHTELIKHRKATAQDSISIEAIRNVIIAIPPLEEQRRIVDKYEEIKAIYRKLTEAIK